MASYGLTIESGVTITSGITLPILESDDYFEYTTLLLPGNGTNGAQNNTFLDGSTNNYTITRNGNTTQGTFSPFSQTGWGNYFDGSGDSLVPVSANTANAMGTGDWTFETWVYKIGTGQESIFDTLAASGGTTDAIRIRIDASASGGAIIFFRYGTVVTSGGTVTLNTWNHIALVRQSGTLKIYLNGTQVNTTYNDSGVNYTCGASRPIIGIDGFGGTSNAFTGYISNLRTVKGVAVYTGAFTPPTLPLAATQSAGTNISAITGTQTSLLTCQSNRFIDNSTNNFTITPNGNTSVVPFSPFNPTSAWSASTVGGSGYYDGTGDSLTIPTAQASLGFGTGDFSTEFWAYRTNSNSFIVVFQLNTYNTGLYVRTESTTYNDSFYFVNQSYDWDPATNFKPNSWTHICVTRQSGTLRFFANGKLIVNATNTSNMGTATADIGASGYAGYLSGVRVVKGSVPSEYQTSITTVGTQVFNPPTAPPTNVTDTQLLLNFTNSGIYDATAKNVLETVADAQISNTTAKWGSTSIKFDGTGDYLLAPDSSLLNLNGDFTAEAWVYLANVTGEKCVFHNHTSDNNGIALAVNGAAPRIVSGAGTWNIILDSSITISANTWNHIAATRSGNTYTIWVNGVSGGTASSATNPTYSGGAQIGRFTAALPLAFNGYIQDLRITKGYARYTANFTPPTAAFPTF